MAMIKPIHSEEDYAKTLARIGELMDAEKGSPEGDELDVLVTLVESYEADHVPMPPPDPIEAIKFRLDQSGLYPRDLIPLIGSRAKVHEVLSGKRAITMPMARALYEHLGIPAEILLRSPETKRIESLTDLDPHRYPIKKMLQLRWIRDDVNWPDNVGKILAELIQKAGVHDVTALNQCNYRQRVNAKTDPYALQAWCWQTMAVANSRSMPCEYVSGTVTLEFLREVAKLSCAAEGPLLAKRLLAERGIDLEVVPHLPKTYLDGAALLLTNGRPVIGLTLRQDRLDHFWFSLLHELAHVGLHLDQGEGRFFADDFTLRDSDQIREESHESDADAWADEALIPTEIWLKSEVRESPSTFGVLSLASQLQVHPAIVAGKIRYENKNYRLLSQFVGRGVVRSQFEE